MTPSRVTRLSPRLLGVPVALASWSAMAVHIDGGSPLWMSTALGIAELAEVGGH